MCALVQPIHLQITPTIGATDAAALVAWYLGPSGPLGGKRYYERRELQTGTDNEVGLVDLGWAVLIAGRPTYGTAARLIDEAISIKPISMDPLHLLPGQKRQEMADCIATFMGRFNEQPSYMGASLATKLIHPKRRASVPVMDNKTIYGRFMKAGWQPGKTGRAGAPKGAESVKRCLDAIHSPVADPGNQPGWTALERRFEGFTRIELFDMLWTAIERGGSATNGYWR
jgi:hypothetical protein